MDKKGFFHIIWSELSYNTKEYIKTIVKKEFSDIQIYDDYNNLRYINAIYYNNKYYRKYFNSEIENDIAIGLSLLFGENIHLIKEYFEKKKHNIDTYVEDTIDLILLQNFFFNKDLKVNIYLYHGIDEENTIKQYYIYENGINNIYITYSYVYDKYELIKKTHKLHTNKNTIKNTNKNIIKNRNQNAIKNTIKNRNQNTNILNKKIIIKEEPHHNINNLKNISILCIFILVISTITK